MDDIPLPELPPEIVTALRPIQPSLPNTSATVDESIENASPSTKAFLAGEYADGPEWNDRLFRAACDLAGRGMSRDEAEPLLLDGAKPWDEANADIARRTIESAFSTPRESAEY